MSPETRSPGFNNHASAHVSASLPPSASRTLKMASQPPPLVTQKTIEHRDDTLCKLSYAPATQTTVVTTTTTTFTSFPPFVIKTPRNLRERDPKQYPLASSPTPSSLREFAFDVNGVPVWFQEGADAEAAIQGHHEQQTDLSESNGTSVSTFTTDTHYSKPGHLPAPEYFQQEAHRLQPMKRRAPDYTTPVSLRKAATIVQSERPSKRSKLDLVESQNMEDVYDDTLATPEREGSVPRKGSRSKKTRSRPGTARGRNGSSSTSLAEPLLPDPVAGPPSPPSFTTGPGMAATPPVIETDFDPMAPYQPSSLESQERPAPVNTSISQGPVLPSPLLSPVTAAATPVHLDTQDDITIHGDDTPLHNGDESSELMLIGSDSLENTQLSNPPMLDVPNIIESFDSLPDKVQTYVMYQLLRRCNKPTLHFVANVVNPALKRDFLTQLPLEMALEIVKFLDAKTLCKAAQVSRRWRHIINSDNKAWRDLLKKDEFALPPSELDRARREGWEWQGLESYEKDLSIDLHTAALEPPTPVRITRSTHAAAIAASSLQLPQIRKRKHAAKHGSNKRRKTKHIRNSSLSITSLPANCDMSDDEISHPALDADVPELGLKSLRERHLYKTIYRRHHSIRRSWMNGTEPKHIAFRAHGRHVVTCLQFDSDKLITGSDDTKIHIYNSNNGALRLVLHGHEGGVWALQYDGNMLVSGSTDRTVRVWDLTEGNCLHTFQGHTSTVRCLVILKPTVIGHEPDGTPIVMPKEPLIITGSRDSTLRVWKLPKEGDREYHQLPNYADEEENPYFVRVLAGHVSSVRAIAARGDTLVSGSYDSTVRVWKISTGETVHRLTGHSQKVYSVILDNDRNRCISGSMDNSVKIWSLDTGACLLTLEGHTSLVGLLDLNHDRLVSAAADSTLRIWDPDTGQCKSTLTAHTGAITCFQHDGQKVISGSDRTLKLWDIKTGECVKDLLTNLSGVWQVKFNDRKCVAAVQRNNWTYIEVLDFGASRDGIPESKRGWRTVVDEYGDMIEDISDDDDLDDQA